MASYTQTDEAMKAINSITGIVNRVNSALNDVGANKQNLLDNISKIQTELDDPDGVDFQELTDSIENANNCISLLDTIEESLV